MGSMPYGIPPPIYYPGIGYPTFNDNRAAISATAFPWATSLASTNTGAGCHGFPSVDYAQAGLRVENKAATGMLNKLLYDVALQTVTST